MRIDGKEIAQQILKKLKQKVDVLKKRGITPALSIILIGDNNSSLSYIKQKKLRASKMGHWRVKESDIEKFFINCMFFNGFMRNFSPNTYLGSHCKNFCCCHKG